MHKTTCDSILDESFKELSSKGTSLFPIAIFNDDLKDNPVAYHWHEELELIAVIKGEMEIVIGFEKHIVKSGEGIFINASRLHSCINFDSSDCIIKSIVFHPKFIYGDTDSALYINYFKNFLDENSISTQKLNKKDCEELLYAYNLFINANFGFEFIIRETLSKILISIFSVNENLTTTTNIKKQKQLNRCKIMMQFIHENYNKEISLIEIASSANVKQSEALRCFKLVLNTSPIKYLKNYRIEQSARLLKTTTEYIIDIALKCGFNEMSYFSKSFKEVYNYTPTEYRKQYFLQ